jgi:alkaline phosphatase
MTWGAWCVLALLAGCEGDVVTVARNAPAADAPAEGDPFVATPLGPPGIVLMIGDGMGYGQLEAARLSGGPLVIETLPRVGELRTASADSDVTDSAAAATALASGVITRNFSVGVDVDGKPVRTVVHAALERGMAAGVVTTASVVTATPAAFLAHAASRSMLEEIARQVSESHVQVLLGGGRQYFSAGTRKDGADLISRFPARGCEYGETASLLMLAASRSCIVGLLAPGEMAFASAGRSPSLADMATAALAVMLQNPEGFFLLVESDEIDKRGHANDAAGVIAEVRAFDQAVAAVLQALEGRSNTLIIVTADHETGGLYVASRTPLAFGFLTNAHTTADVPLFARGPGASRFVGSRPTWSAGRALMELVEGN